MHARFAGLAVALVACVDPTETLDGGQTGGEQDVPCLETRSAIGWDEAPESVGRSPAEWVGAWPASWAADLAWGSGGTTGISLALDVDPASAALVVREPSTRDVDPADCADVLEVDGALDVAIADLQDTLAVRVRSEGTTGSFAVAVADPDAVIAASGDDPAGWTDPVVGIEAVVRPDGTSGTLQGYGAPDAPGEWVELASWATPED